MGKLNPLFVDSTKDNTDSVGMDIELNKILLRDNEEVFCVVKNNKGLNIEKQLDEIDFGFYGCQIWLNHQQELTVYFVVKKENQIVAASSRHKIRGAYFYKMDWEADDKFLKEIQLTNKMPENNPNFVAYQAVHTDDENSVDYWETQTAATKAKSLLNKWGF